ncbi:MAG: hypothetical protein FWB91_13865 [Defluviitaleaceae bacterium]|nr:hypothetical protein [Defluviitaleaceae bacterium]
MERFKNPIFMTNQEINKTYEGKFVLVGKKDANVTIFDGGYVLAVADDTSENHRSFIKEVRYNLQGTGYVHYAYIDKGDDLRVVFSNFR